MTAPLYLNPFGQPVDIVACSIEKGDLTTLEKAQLALDIGLPIADPEVVFYARRWVADADAQDIKSSAIEQIREIIGGYTYPKRGSKIKETPALKQSLWDKLF